MKNIVSINGKESSKKKSGYDFWDIYYNKEGIDFNDPEYDEVCEKVLADINDAKSLIPYFIMEILKDHSSAVRPLTIVQINNYLVARPYEIGEVDRKTLSRALRTLAHFTGRVERNMGGFYYSEENCSLIA